jgi:hypothetical protein
MHHEPVVVRFGHQQDADLCGQSAPVSDLVIPPFDGVPIT